MSQASFQEDQVLTDSTDLVVDLSEETRQLLAFEVDRLKVPLIHLASSQLPTLCIWLRQPEQ